MANQDPKQAGVKQGTIDREPDDRGGQGQRIGSTDMGGATSDDLAGVGPGGPTVSTHEERAGHAGPGGEPRADAHRSLDEGHPHHLGESAGTRVEGDVRRVGIDKAKSSEGFGNE